MKTKKKEITIKTRLIKTLMTSLIVTVMAFGISGATHAQTCRKQTLQGLYLFTAHGWNIVGGAAVPKAIVEGIDFNGDGTLVSPFATVSVNGTIIRSGVSTGFYTVDADGRGTLTFTGGPSFDIFVEAGGKQLWMIQTGPAAAPAVFEGTATRVE
jgi:hypothetical protein